jgi:plasmid stabilization system protein ParE
MKKYTVTQAAKRDLMVIAQYGDEYYGIEKSDQYRGKLEQKFISMAEHP